MKQTKLFRVVITVALMALTSLSAQDKPETTAVQKSWEDSLAEMPVKVVLFPIRHTIISAEVDGVITSYKFNEGEHFNRGDLLVSLDERSYVQRLEKAKSAVSEAQASYDFAIKNLARNKEMLEKDIGSVQEVERCELERDVNMAKLKFNQANQKMAEQELAACSIKAPFSGRIVRKFIQEFEYVRMGGQLVGLIDDSRILAAMHLPSADKKTLKIGQEMQIKIDETGNIHLGKVYEISAESDPASRTFEVKVVLENTDRQLSSGWSGQLIRAAQSNPQKETESD